ncbi:MAG: hypothetical protein ABH859_04270 [Pseudomonadota bacterium]
MINIKKIIIGVLIILILGLVKLVQAQDGIVIVVNKLNSLNTMSKGQLISIYRGQDTLWPDGQMIILVNQTMLTQPRNIFYKKVLGVSPATKFYLPGTMAPIRTVLQPSDEGVKLFVSNMPNAIGYIGEEAVDDSIKVLKIDDKIVIH